MKERDKADGAGTVADAVGPLIKRTRSDPCLLQAFTNADVQTPFSMLMEMLEKLEKHLVPSKEEVTAMKDLISDINLLTPIAFRSNIMLNYYFKVSLHPKDTFARFTHIR